MNIQKKWEVFLIHHSHTDIGYTERQDKLTRYHVDFIKQAIDILNDIHIGKKPEYKGFVWQCENHWQVRNFYSEASEEYIKDFVKYVKSGEIGLSGNYLNMTDLICYDVLNSRIKTAKDYGESIGVNIKSGMAADVDGFAWGYGDCLYENGVENFFSCLHTHHGMQPLYEKFMPFYWKTPKGNKVLVFNSEQYHYGNELHFAPHGGTSYLTYDVYSDELKKDSLFKENNSKTEEKELEILEFRLGNFLRGLEEDGYKENFIPIMVSGAISDNAPPNPEIARRVNYLNEKYKDKIHVKMVTLDQFFEHLRENWKDIPTYGGDWTDWWADGVGSTPDAVKVFKNAQRKYSLCKKLDNQNSLGDAKLLEEASENLMMYAEHTWGYSSSVSEPWESFVGELDFKKAAYSVNASTAISKNLDKILAKKGEISITSPKNQFYTVINPNSFELNATAQVYVEFWEYLDGMKFSLNVPFEVFDIETGEVLPSQAKTIARAYEIEVEISLSANQERKISIRPTREVKSGTVGIKKLYGSDAVIDIIFPNEKQINTSLIETKYFDVYFSQTNGITKIINKKTNKNIIREDTKYPAFTGVYEVTEIKTDAVDERRRMGRNRKAPHTKRYFSKQTNIQIIEQGDVYVSVKIDYELEGTKFYSLILKIYYNLARIDAIVRLHKESVWEPENLYVSLPFTTGETEEKYIDKAGCFIRPGIDQLPGTNKEFYITQNAIVLDGETTDVIISTKDAPLVVFGELEAKPIELCTGKDTKFNNEISYSWVMNNFWETNFKVDLGGFYDFAYSILACDKIEVKDAFALAEATNEGLVSFYSV